MTKLGEADAMPAASWRHNSNRQRPLSLLGSMPPARFAARLAANQAVPQ